MCAGENNYGIFEGAFNTYKQLCKGMNWIDKGSVFAYGILNKGAIANTDYLKSAEELGYSF